MVDGTFFFGLTYKQVHFRNASACMCGDNECVVLYMHKSVLDVCIILHRTVILHSSPMMHNYSRNLTLDRLAQLLRNGQHLNPQEATHDRYKDINTGYLN